MAGALGGIAHAGEVFPEDTVFHTARFRQEQLRRAQDLRGLWLQPPLQRFDLRSTGWRRAVGVQDLLEVRNHLGDCSFDGLQTDLEIFRAWGFDLREQNLTETKDVCEGIADIVSRLHCEFFDALAWNLLRTAPCV